MTNKKELEELEECVELGLTNMIKHLERLRDDFWSKDGIGVYWEAPLNVGYEYLRCSISDLKKA